VQVYLSYGDYKCNLQLLLEYGFELENNTATCPEENVTSLNNNKNNANKNKNNAVSGDTEDDDDDGDSDDEEEEKEKRPLLKPRLAVSGNRGRHGNRLGTNEDNRQPKDSRRRHSANQRDTPTSLKSRPRARTRVRGGRGIDTDTDDDERGAREEADDEHHKDADDDDIDRR
jgi:hypothetical protein